VAAAVPSRDVTQKTPPRIYCIPATEAPVVAVFRRGPTRWSHVGRWDLAAGHYEPGAWIAARLFPRRSDLSPDGRWLCYFAHDPKARWEHGESYVALAKLPWLRALHAFPTCGTWTRGYHFTDPGDGDDALGAGLPIPYGLRATRAGQFATEARRGWTEAPDSPPRHETDAWDQYRNARMRKPQPGGERVLCVESVDRAGGAFGVDQSVDGLAVRYSLEADGDVALLSDLQWADWDVRGRLLGATRAGAIQIRELSSRRSEVVFEADLSQLAPDPQPAPEWAGRWSE